MRGLTGQRASEQWDTSRSAWGMPRNREVVVKWSGDPGGVGMRIAMGITAILVSFPLLADTVTMKSGVVYRGTVDRDGTILTVYDGQKRVVVRDTKVQSVKEDAIEQVETFRVDQPLVVHTGAMPQSAIRVIAGPWDDKGQRSFEYVASSTLKPVRMTQALNELGPRVSQLRGVDGFWRAPVTTSLISREVIVGLLHRVDQKDQAERLKVGRFLIQAEWYPEALAELDRLKQDFPDIAETIETVRAAVLELQARKRIEEISHRRRGQQPRRVRTLLEGFGTNGAPAEVLDQVRKELSELEAQELADRAIERSVRESMDGLTESRRIALREPLLELLGDLAAAPDAVRERVRSALQESDGAESKPETRVSRVLSNWMGGPGLVTEDLQTVQLLWEARQQMTEYLAGRDESVRASVLERLKMTRLPLKDGQDRPLDPGILTELARHAPPPLRSKIEEEPGSPRRLRAQDDTNVEPTEYVVVLPPEYHPARRYPVLVALHGGEGPEAAAAWWSDEGSRRGYIVIAPEYNLKGQPKDYRYSESEHAAVSLSIRDARRRFSIDSNRVFLAGMLLGGDMAWDFGLAHPDLLAGVAILNGMPGKYVWAYRDNAKWVPMYVAMGDLAPIESDVIFPFGTSLVARNFDVVYVEYYKRGLERLPEERNAVFDWMASRRRDPYPKEFEVVAARASDDRFFGVVAREFDADRVKAPEQVDPFGKNLKPATIKRTDRTLANLLDLEASGVERVDLWLGPPHLDVSNRLEIRINGKSAFRGRPPLDLAPFLEDLRVRGDREQVYWLKYSATVGRSRR